MWVLFPISVAVCICQFIQGISFSRMFSPLYILDSVVAIAWAAFAFPAFAGLCRRSPRWYCLNLRYQLFICAYITVGTVLKAITMKDMTLGSVLLSCFLLVLQILEITYYRKRMSLLS